MTSHGTVPLSIYIEMIMNETRGRSRPGDAPPIRILAPAGYNSYPYNALFQGSSSPLGPEPPSLAVLPLTLLSRSIAIAFVIASSVRSFPSCLGRFPVNHAAIMGRARRPVNGAARSIRPSLAVVSPVLAVSLLLRSR